MVLADRETDLVPASRTLPLTRRVGLDLPSQSASVFDVGRSQGRVPYVADPASPTNSPSNPGSHHDARPVSLEVPHSPAPAPDRDVTMSGASGGAASGGGSPAPTVFAVLFAALAAMAQLARMIVRAPAFARSVSLVLVVERPG